MKINTCLILLLILFTYGNSYGQIIKNDSIIDGIHLRHFLTCDIDTTVNIYSNSQLEWTDTLKNYQTNYDFSAGDKSYFELIIKTKKCRCSDCDFVNIILIPIDQSNTLEVIHFDETNAFWIIRNTWSIIPFLDSFVGTLDFQKNQLSINHTLKGKSTFSLHGETIVHKGISIIRE